MSEDNEPLTCHYCVKLATEQLEVDTAIDSTEAEEGQFYLCEACAKRAILAFNICNHHLIVALDTDPDNVPNGYTMIRASKLSEDEDELSEYYAAHIICTGCADMALPIESPN